MKTPVGVSWPFAPVLTEERPTRMPFRYTLAVCSGRLTSTTTGPDGETCGFHQYSPGCSGPVGLPVGVPLVWKDGCAIAPTFVGGWLTVRSRPVWVEEHEEKADNMASANGFRIFVFMFRF